MLSKLNSILKGIFLAQYTNSITEEQVNLGLSILTNDKFDEMLGSHHRLAHKLFISEQSKGNIPEETFPPFLSFVNTNNSADKHPAQTWILDGKKFNSIRLSDLFVNNLIKLESIIVTILGATVGYFIDSNHRLIGVIIGAFLSYCIGVTINYINLKLKDSIKKLEQSLLEQRGELIKKGVDLFSKGNEIIAVFMSVRLVYDKGEGKNVLLTVGRTFDGRTNNGQSEIQCKTVFSNRTLSQPTYNFASQLKDRKSSYEFFTLYNALFRMIDCIFMGFLLGSKTHSKNLLKTYLRDLMVIQAIPFRPISWHIKYLNL